MPTPRLVVGLGNPGPRYEGTRHNVGFCLVDKFSPDAGWKEFKGLGHYLHRDELTMGKPMTFMNESGRFVAALGRFYKIPASDMLICLDDVDLPLGRIRLRVQGSSGGHKGMQSIIEHMGTPVIPRLRIGVGPIPMGRDGADFVLGKFSKPESEILEGALETASTAIAASIEEGVESAMNRFNAAP